MSRLSFLTFNTSASYRTTYYTKSADDQGRVVDEPLWRQYFTLRSDVVGPVLAKIWDTPGSGYSERMKHLIEPTFAFEYISPIPNARNVLDALRFERGDSRRVGSTDLWHQQSTIGSRADVRRFGGDDRSVSDLGIQQTYYATERSSLNDTQYVSTSFHSRPVDLSDIAVGIKVTPNELLDSTTRLEYSVHGEGLHVVTTGTTARIGEGATSLSYSRYRRSATAKPESSLTWATNVGSS